MSDVFRAPWPTPLYNGTPSVPSGAAAPTGRTAIVTWASLGFPASGSVLVDGAASLSGQGDLNADGFVSKIVMSGTVEAEAALFAEGELTEMAGTVEAEVDAAGDVFQQGRGAEVVVTGTAVLTSGEIPLHDTFTGGNGTLLENHVPESGGTWIRHASSTDSAEIDTNRVRGSVGVGPALYSASYNPPSADYQVQAVIYCASNTGSVMFTGRFSTATGHHYAMGFTSGFGWRIAKDVGSGLQSVAPLAGPTSLTVGASYVARLSMIGTEIVGFVDEVRLMEGIDSAISGAGHAGVRLDARTTGTGYHIDTIDVLSIGVTGAATLTGTGTLTADGTVIPSTIFVTMTGTGGLTATGKQSVRGAATMSGQGSLSARGGRLVLPELDPGSLVLTPLPESSNGLVPLAAGSFTLVEQEKR